MIGNESKKPSRSLAEIEGDLIKAEEAFADADARYKLAQRDRSDALRNIDKHQVELDERVVEMHRRSVPGTKWRQEMGDLDGTLELHSEDIVAEAARNASPEASSTAQEAKKVVSKDFDILRASADTLSDDPVLKVVSGPRR